MHRTELGRLRARDERLDVVQLFRAERRRLEAGAAIDVERRESFGPGPGRWYRTTVVDFLHHRGPGRSRQNSALRVALDLPRLVEPNPDAGDQVGGEPDEPHVEAVVGGAGLAAGRGREVSRRDCGIGRTVADYVT